jgi:flavin-binding protein dodecin
MGSSIYKKIDLTGTSDKSLEEAIENAVSKASDSIRNMRWFEVVEIRGAIEDGKVTQWQVNVKIGFKVE